MEQKIGQFENRLEFKEKEGLRPALTVYLIRHGESGKDKTNPKRGLTDKGREQVEKTLAGIINEIIADEVPDFTAWNDEKARVNAFRHALEKVSIHLRDSGTDRTIEQEWVEYDQLQRLGARPEDVNLPASAYAWKEEEAPERAGPGIQKRLRGVRGLDHAPEFRKKISDREYQAGLGAKDEVVAWALTPEDKIPADVETKAQMIQRKDDDLARVENVAGTRLAANPKRTIYIANSHASIVSLTAAGELGIPLEKLGEVKNAEGLRLDFYGAGAARTAKPIGEHIGALASETKI